MILDHLKNSAKRTYTKMKNTCCFIKSCPLGMIYWDNMLNLMSHSKSKCSRAEMKTVVTCHESGLILGLDIQKM